MIAYIYWNPSRVMISLLDVDVYWYTFFFLMQFVVNYFFSRQVVIFFLKKESLDQVSDVRSFLNSQVALKTIKEKARVLVNIYFISVFIGIVLGAKIGHYLFYENISTWIRHPLKTLLSKGGFASHGAIAGWLIAVWYARRKLKSLGITYSFLQIIDFAILSILFGSTCIRIGNLFNQEILGSVTNVPWAFVFGRPVDGITLPRHAVQLYEAIGYFFFFVLFSFLMRKTKIFDKPGRLCGLSFILVFSFRFMIEFLKVDSSYYQFFHLNMGQLLSLPFILMGIVILVKDKVKVRRIA